MKSLKKNCIIIDNSIFDALKLMKTNSSKCLVVLDQNSKFLGTLSDGDIRRAILKNISLDLDVKKIYHKKSFYIKEKEKSKFDLKEIFKNNKYEIIPVVDSNHYLIEIIHWSEVVVNDSEKSYQLKDNTKISLFVMAGGKGLRLKPITNFLPKSLLPINGEPIISKIINKFSEIGVRDFHISINIKDTITKSYINTSLKQGLKINIYQEKEALGTIGALGFFKKIKKSIKAIIVSNCDTLISYDLNKVLKNHFDKKADMTIIAVKDNYSIPYGVIQTDRNNFLTDVIEKPNYDYIFSSGVYILNLNLLRIIKKNQKMDFNEFVNKALKNKFKINVYNITRDKWIDIGNFTELNKVIN